MPKIRIEQVPLQFLLHRLNTLLNRYNKFTIEIIGSYAIVKCRKKLKHVRKL